MTRASTSHSAPKPRGSVAIEYGLVLPALLLLTFGAMDMGRLFWARATLYRAVEAAARCGAINADITGATQCASTGAIQAKAVAEAWGLQVTADVFTVNRQATCGVQVNASYPFTFYTPWAGGPNPGNAMTLTAVACYPVATP